MHRTKLATIVSGLLSLSIGLPLKSSAYNKEKSENRMPERQAISEPEFDWVWRNIGFMPPEFGRRWIVPVSSGIYVPRIDVDAAGDMVKISAEVPGIDGKNLDVTIMEDTVSIKGEKKAEDKEDNGNGVRSGERCYGAFERTISLPCSVDKDKAEAKLRNGVLTILAPKMPAEKIGAKKLTIQL